VVEVSLVATSAADAPVLARLLQLYEYDYSEYGGVDVDASGLFPTVDTNALWQPGSHAFLLEIGGCWAGFALVNRHEAYIGGGETMLVDEFFVLRKYRRRGIGECVARTVFDRFPRRWEIGTLRENAAAVAFWRRTIERYTGGQFRELPDGCERWPGGPVWAFKTPTEGTGELLVVPRVSESQFLDSMPPSVREAFPDPAEFPMTGWTERDLWRLELPVEEVPVGTSTWLLDLPVWRWEGRRFQISLNDVLRDPGRYHAHEEKAERADTTYPIHVTLHKGRWVILDGYHRLLKTLTQGAPTIKVVKVRAGDLA
jgi:predicted acetyltransferase